MDKEVLEKVETKVEPKATSETKVETEKQKKLAEDFICAYPIPKKAEKDVSLNIDKKEEASQQVDLKKEPESEPLSEYLSSFKNLTLKDVKKEEVQEEIKEVEKEEVVDIAESIEPEVEEHPKVKEEKKKTTLVIRKPNYDLMPKEKGTVKKKKKLKTALLACALAVCSIGCVAGAVVCDNMNSHYLQLEDSYNLNLIDYLNKINNLNATNKGFEFIETYPEEINEISSIGESTNWFDNLVNFITGLFGG